MKEAYPVILSESSDGYNVTVPDFNISTQGKDIPDAICKARDAIGFIGVDMEDNGKELSKPSSIKIKVDEADIITLVDVDFTEYRKKVDNRAVKKNLTIPYTLKVGGETAGINFSQVSQGALIDLLRKK
jgi:predicted RNase H-like HicB family nuclease